MVGEARQEESRSSDSADLSVGHELRRGREGGGREGGEGGRRDEDRGENGVGRERRNKETTQQKRGRIHETNHTRTDVLSIRRGF